MPSNIFSRRQILTYVAVALIVSLADPIAPTFAGGLALALCGIAIRVWGCGHLRKNESLITSGPYARVKHPLYLGTFLIAVGAIIAAGSPELPGLVLWAVLGPIFLIAFFAYYLPKKKRVEGGRLARVFSEEFDAWDRAVPAFIPALTAYRGAPDQRWSWRIFLSNHELPMDLLIVALFGVVSLASTIRPWG